MEEGAVPQGSCNSGMKPWRRAVAYGAYMGDDWRVRIAFGVLPRGRRAFRQALIPAVGSRLGDQVTVSSGNTNIFVYAPSIGLADQAAQVARELLVLHDIDVPVRTEFWSQREQQWLDADDPSAGPAAQRPADPPEAQRHADRQEAERKRSVMTGVPAWQVRIEVPSHRDAIALAGHLAAQGWRPGDAPGLSSSRRTAKTTPRAWAGRCPATAALIPRRPSGSCGSAIGTCITKSRSFESLAARVPVAEQIALLTAGQRTPCLAAISVVQQLLLYCSSLKSRSRWLRPVTRLGLKSMCAAVGCEVPA